MGNCLMFGSKDFSLFGNSVIPGPMESLSLSKTLEYTIPGRMSWICHLRRREAGDTTADAHMMVKVCDRLIKEGNHDEAARLRIMGMGGYILRSANTTRTRGWKKGGNTDKPVDEEEIEMKDVEGFNMARARVAINLKNEAGYVFLKYGNYNKSLELYTKAHDIQVGIFGADNYKCLKTLLDVAMVLSTQSKFKEALQFYNQVYQGYRLIFQDLNHPDVVFVLSRIGWSLSEDGEHYDEAMAILKQVYEVQRVQLGQRDPACMDTYHWLMATNQKIQDRGQRQVRFDPQYLSHGMSLGQNQGQGQDQDQDQGQGQGQGHVIQTVMMRGEPLEISNDQAQLNESQRQIMGRSLVHQSSVDESHMAVAAVNLGHSTRDLHSIVQV